MRPENLKRKAQHYRWLATRISDRRTEEALKEMTRKLEERADAEEPKPRKI
jgi:hypothetical protein